MKIDNALIIFARKPELGKVKTRLAATLGNEKALDIYKMLLHHTKKVAKEANCETYVFLTEHTNDFYWNDFYTEIQVGDTLGDKMKNAFISVIGKGYKNCIIIGSDCPDLQSDLVNKAFEALAQKDVVIGPTIDGGYYLLGMKKLETAFFENKIWSSSTVFADSIKNVAAANLNCFTLPMLRDVDEAEDVPEAWL